MRGGFRPGAGRKAGEPTIRLRVPVAILPAVQGLIEAHKKVVPFIKPNVPDTEVLKVEPEKTVSESFVIQRRLERLESLPNGLLKRFRQQVGKLKDAADKGWTATGRAGKNLMIFNELTREVWNG